MYKLNILSKVSPPKPPPFVVFSGLIPFNNPYFFAIHMIFYRFIQVPIKTRILDHHYLN